MDRRRFLSAIPALGLTASLRGRRAIGGGSAAPSVTTRAIESIDRTERLDALGVQMYTLRSLLSEDPDATLASVAQVGYTEVEFAGLYGNTPREMRRKLDAVGLRCVSSHHGVNEIRGDWARFVEGAQELGQTLVVVPSIPVGEQTSEGIRRVADDFNRAAEVARSGGLRFGYHNHAWEFASLPDGMLMIDLLLERTDAALVDWQMDIFWTVQGGGNPMAYLDEHAGRVTTVHVKDRTADGQMVDVGRGVIDFASILPKAETQGLLHALVEHDTPGDPIASIRYSYASLRALGV